MAGRSKAIPAQVAKMAPMKNCPSTPTLKTPVRNARAEEMAVKMSGVQRWRVMKNPVGERKAPRSSSQ